MIPETARRDAIERALVFRVASIGDMVVAVPALRAFWTAHAPERVVLLTDERNARAGIGGGAVLGGSGLIHETWTHSGLLHPVALAQLALKIRRERFDTVLYLPPRERSATSIRRDRAFFRACGIEDIIGPTTPRLDPAMFGTKPLPRVASEAADLVAILRDCGMSVSPPRPEDFDLNLQTEERAAARAALAPHTQSHETLVGVSMGAKLPSKRWPLGHFEATLKRVVAELRCTPVFVGGADDRREADAMIGRVGRGVNLCGTLTVRVSAAVLAQCRAFVGNDSGPMHLAYAVGTVCIVPLAARDLPGRWEPTGAHRVFRTDIECAGCQLAKCPRNNECVRVITPDMVVDACRDVLSRWQKHS